MVVCCRFFIVVHIVVTFQHFSFVALSNHILFLAFPSHASSYAIMFLTSFLCVEFTFFKFTFWVPSWDGLAWEAGCKQRKARSNCDNVADNKTKLGPCASKSDAQSPRSATLFLLRQSYGCDWCNGPCVCTNRGTFSKTRQKCWPASVSVASFCQFD